MIVKDKQILKLNATELDTATISGEKTSQFREESKTNELSVVANKLASRPCPSSFEFLFNQAQFAARLTTNAAVFLRSSH